MDVYEHIEAVEMAASNLLGVVVICNQANGELMNGGDCYGTVVASRDYLKQTFEVEDSRTRKLFDLVIYEDGQ